MTSAHACSPEDGTEMLAKNFWELNQFPKRLCRI